MNPDYLTELLMDLSPYGRKWGTFAEFECIWLCFCVLEGDFKRSDYEVELVDV